MNCSVKLVQVMVGTLLAKIKFPVAVHRSVKLAQVMVGTLLAKVKFPVAVHCSVKLAQPQVLPITTAITAFLEKFRKIHAMEPCMHSHIIQHPSQALGAVLDKPYGFLVRKATLKLQALPLI